jgi:iron complex outermembrane receptor protein
MKALTTAARRERAFGRCLLLLMSTACSYAEAAPPPAGQAFDIAPQTLASALQQFASQSGREILFAPSLAVNKRSVGVHGAMDAQSALRILLQGSGLEFRTTPGGAMLVDQPGRAMSEADILSLQPNPTTSNQNRIEMPAKSETAAPPSGGAVDGSTAEQREKMSKHHSFWSRIFQLFTGDRDGATATRPPQGAARLLALCGSLTAAGGVCAQDAPAQAAAAGQLEEIVVTAEKREEDISKTPLAITAISGDELLKNDVTNVVQLQYLAPSMQVTQTAQGVYVSIRGVSTTDRTSKGEPGIQFNTDGIPVNQPEEQGMAMFDVQRVEVLSGPQGTLYGKSSTGGAINVITNAPVLEHEDAEVSVELGNCATKRINAMVNEPLGEGWAVRVAGVANVRKGYIELVGSHANDFPGDENNLVGRLSLLGSLGESVKVRLTGMAGRIDAVGGGGASLNVDGNNNVTASVIGAGGNPFPGVVRDDFQRGYGQIDTDLGPTHLVYLGSYSHYATYNQQSNHSFGAASSNQGDAANGNRLLVRDGYDTTYHELRLSNRDEGALQWLAGVNYFYEHVNENGHIWQIAQPVAPCPPSGGPPYCQIVAAGGDPAYQNGANLLNYTTHESYGVFAHGVYEFIPDWHLTLGVREGTDKIARTGTFRFSPFALNAQGTICINGQDCVSGPGPGSGPFVGQNNTGSGNASKFVWNVGLDHQFTPTQFGYARVATGYKAGGFNDFDPRNGGSFGIYSPEQMVSYEAGYKIHTSSVDLNSAVYFYNYSNEQINGSFTVNLGGTLQNIGVTLGVPTQLYGWENSLKWAFAADDLLSLEADFEHSKYNSDLLVNGINFSGNALNSTPSAVLSAGYTHTFPLSGGATLALHGDVRYSSAYYLTNFNTGVQYRQGSFTRSNAIVTYTSASGKLETELFVTNLENKIQATGGVTAYPAGTAFPPGYSYEATGEVSQPRFYGIRESLKF